MSQRNFGLRFERLEPRRVLATLSINAGGGVVESFLADRSFSGGGTFTTGDTIAVAGAPEAAPASVYQTERTGQGGSDFRYDITGLLPGESYTLRLHFAEIFWTEANQRSFDVEINGSQVLDNYDVFVEAGGADRAVVEEFTTSADTTGGLRIDFLTEINNAKLSGLEVIGEFPPEAPKPTVLFVRGADRSGGFLEANNDTGRTEQLADINNTSTSGGNHGWFELHQTLLAAGFGVEQITETAENASGPSQGIHLDFESMDLSEYDAIVFGSNNAVYDTAAVDAVEDYVRGGGSTLFISDANFGSDWADASNSDQQFLDRFGLIMHQDQGTYQIARSDGEFFVPDHPLFTNVDRIDGEGVTPLRLSPAIGSLDVDATILARAEGSTRLNQAPFGNQNRGPSRSSNAGDAAVLVAAAGEGKIAGHFDRNTFFNQNGAGTNINRFDNKQYALNLFGWLVGAFDPLPGDYDGNGTVETADRDLWASAYGTVGPSSADGNGDGRVDAADYTVWRDNLGATRPDLDLSAPSSSVALAIAPPAAVSSGTAALPAAQATTVLVAEAIDLSLLLIASSEEESDNDRVETLSASSEHDNREEAFAALDATAWRGVAG